MAQPGENPLHQMLHRLKQELSHQRFQTILDCVSDKIPSSTKKELAWEHGDEPLDRHGKIERLLEFLREEYTEEGMYKILINMSQKIRLQFNENGQNVSLKTFLEKSEKDWENYQNHRREKGILEDFVGRRDAVQSVAELLQRPCDGTSGTWIYGISGTGKTTLSNQVCYREKYKRIYVDLKAVTTISDFYYKLIGALGLPLSADHNICWDYIIDALEKNISGADRGTVLLLDSIERLLSPKDPNEEVLKKLSGILSIKKPQGKGSLKVLVTSVYGLDMVTKNMKEVAVPDAVKNFEEYALDRLTEDECAEVFRIVAPKADRYFRPTPDDIKKLAKSCDHNALALKVLASNLNNICNRTSIPTNKGICSYINIVKSGFEVEQTLRNVFDGLDRATKLLLVKISVLKGIPFDFITAGYVMGDMNYTAPTDNFETLARLDLLIKSQLLIKEQPSDFMDYKMHSLENCKFSLHSLMQSVLDEVRHEHIFNADIVEAEKNVGACIKERLQELGRKEARDPLKVGKEISELRPLLRLMVCNVKMNLVSVPTQERYKEADDLKQVIERFMNRAELKKYFEEKRESAKKEGQKVDWLMTSLNIAEVSFSFEFSPEVVLDILLETDKKLRKLEKTSPKPVVRFIRAHYYRVHGFYLAKCGNCNDGIKSAKKALEVYQSAGGEFRRLEARTLALLGTIESMKTCEQANAMRAMEYNEEAYEKLDPTIPHFDLITYSKNIAVQAHEMGNCERVKVRDKNVSDSMKKNHSARMEENYSKAKQFYATSLTLCKRLYMTKTLQYVDVISNFGTLLANWHKDVKEVETAVELCLEAYHLIWNLDGTDEVQRARCCFAIGIVYVEYGEMVFRADLDGVKISSLDPFDLFEKAYDKFSEGYVLVKKGQIADVKDYNGWLYLYKKTMKYLRKPEQEIRKMELDMEKYIAESIQRRSEVVSYLPDKHKKRPKLHRQITAPPGFSHDEADRRPKLKKQTSVPIAPDDDDESVHPGYRQRSNTLADISSVPDGDPHQVYDSQLDREETTDVARQRRSSLQQLQKMISVSSKTDHLKVPGKGAIDSGSEMSDDASLLSNVSNSSAEEDENSPMIKHRQIPRNPLPLPDHQLCNTQAPIPSIVIQDDADREDSATSFSSDEED